MSRPNHDSHGRIAHHRVEHSTPSLPLIAPIGVNELVTKHAVLTTEHLTDQTCSICHEYYMKGAKPEYAVKLPDCGHHFGFKCISRWLEEENNSCPMCRKPVLATLYDDEDYDEEDDDYDDDDYDDEEDYEPGEDAQAHAAGHVGVEREPTVDAVTLPRLGEHLGVDGLDSDDETNTQDTEGSTGPDHAPYGASEARLHPLDQYSIPPHDPTRLYNSLEPYRPPNLPHHPSRDSHGRLTMW